jgi:hypothetical protein
MPTVTYRVPLAANGSVENAISGSIYEFLPWPAAIELGIVADATGVLATVSSGSDLLAEEQPVVIKTINVLPVYPDDFQFADEAMAGDRLKIKLRDTSGAARVAVLTAKITPL